MSVIVKGVDTTDYCTLECDDRVIERCPMYDMCDVRNTIKTGFKPEGCPLKSADGLIEAIKNHHTMSFFTKEDAIEIIKEYCEVE